MRILHTSDWHLGKNLGRFSRLEEQRLFLDELFDIAEESDVSAILVSGDIFDNPNPSASAQSLFFSSVTKLSKGGKRPVILIAGNHDSPERLYSPLPLSLPQGIIIVGGPNNLPPKSSYEHFSISESGKWAFSLHIHNGKKQETAVILPLPYLNEQRFQNLFSKTARDEEMVEGQNRVLASILNQAQLELSPDCPSIMMGHFYANGGAFSGGERPIHLGGIGAVDPSHFPVCDYVALGHLHQAQRVNSHVEHSYYSGAPLQYHLGEATSAKSVYVADINPGHVVTEKIYMGNPRPLVEIKAESVPEALNMAEGHLGKPYFFISLKLKRPLTPDERDALFEAPIDIVDIQLALADEQRDVSREAADFSRDIVGDFADFYRSKYNQEPTEALLNLFGELITQEDSDETAELDHSRH